MSEPHANGPATGMIGRFRAQFQDGRIRRILRDAGITTVSSLISAALNLVRSALLARYLGVTDFGRLAIVLSATTLVRQIISIRAWEWTTLELSRAYVAKDAGRAGGVMKASYLLNVCVNGTAFLIILILSTWFSSTLLADASLTGLLRVNALLLLCIWIDDSSLAGLRVVGRFRWLALYNIVTSVVRLGVLLPAMYFHLGLGGVILVTVLGQAVCSAWLLWKTRRSLRIAFAGPLGGKLMDVLRGWRQHVGMLIIFSATDTVKTLTSETDAVIIGYFRSAAAVAPYRAANQVVTGLHQLAASLYMVFYPEMTKAAAAGDARALRRMVKQTGLFGLAVAIVCGAGLAIAAPILVRVLFGAKFAASAFDLQIMVWSLLLLAAQWANPLFVSLGRTWWTLIMVSVMLVVKATSMFLLVPRLGHVGAAISYTVAAISVVPTAMFLGWNALPLLRDLAARRKPAAGGPASAEGG